MSWDERKTKTANIERRQALRVRYLRRSCVMVDDSLMIFLRTARNFVERTNPRDFVHVIYMWAESVFRALVVKQNRFSRAESQVIVISVTASTEWNRGEYDCGCVLAQTCNNPYGKGCDYDTWILQDPCLPVMSARCGFASGILR